MTDLSHIRNFSIIAHIDHGKSTLADRLLEECHSVEKREMEDQILDSMDLERERGITIKARAVRLDYRADDSENYVLNLIDTPGHVDFNYEVSRSLSACEGAVLVVDASQGIEAQTLANTYLAVDNGLEVLPVVNKIDLPAARPAEVKKEIEDVIGIPAMDAPEISAKNGINIHSVLEMIVNNVPAPTGDREAPLQCLIFDSQYDSYRGAIVYLRVMNGTVRPGMDIRMMASGAVYKVVEVGYLHPKGMVPAESLGAGEVGYLTASIKTVSDTRVGDTITGVDNPAAEPLPGYHQAQPMVFSGVYPADGSKYGDLRDALEKLKLNDASMSFTQENSIALGFGSSGNITSTLSPPRPTSSTRSPRPTARSSTSILRSTTPIPPRSPRRRSPMPRRTSSPRPNTSARSWTCARTAAASSRTCSISTPPASSCTIPCRSTRSSTTSSTRSRAARAATARSTTSSRATARRSS